MLINKDKLPLVAQDFMNDVHLEDVEIINELHQNVLAYKSNKTKENKENIIYTYEKWYSHTENHFKGEEAMMIKLNFPPYLMHKGEHDRCLQKMEEVLQNFISSEDEETLLNYLENDLINWLINHIQTMDTVTAMFFQTGLSPCSAMH